MHVKRLSEQPNNWAEKSSSLSSFNASTSSSDSVQPASSSLYEEDSSSLEEDDENQHSTERKPSASLLQHFPLRDPETSSASTVTSLNFAAIGKHLSTVLQSRYGKTLKLHSLIYYFI